ncbi:MAG: Maf family protein [Verrucomicrobiota bacterium]|nr:Maf family protein [Verrucomicrobiota bacterium]
MAVRRIQNRNLPPIILASVSPRRSELLSELGIPFEVVPSDAIEAHHEALTAREICQLNAYRKARAVAIRHPNHLVIGADTLVYHGTRLYGKPADSADARRMLAELQSTTHEVVTGVCLMHVHEQREKIFFDTTRVTFKPLSEEEIDRYLATVTTLDKAGGYAIQEKGDDLVLKIDGSYSNVVGLPVELLSIELQNW